MAALALALAGALSAQEPVPPVAPSEAQTAKPQTATPPAQAVQPQATPAENSAQPKAEKIIVPSGTKLPLVLHNGISTRSAKAGDPVYLETLFPIIQDNCILIPAGSFVSGEVVEAKRPGRVKGRAEIMIRLNTLILPNGYVASFNAVPSNAGTGGAETVDNEGKIKGDTAKASDIGTVAKTTTAGAGIGGLATRSAKGVGIGAGIGAGAGLLGVLLSRGPEAELPRGTTLDVTLNRPLYLDSDKINFTSPGQASVLAGPSDRQPRRSRFPF
jgi:hypothetical protein